MASMLRCVLDEKILVGTLLAPVTSIKLFLNGLTGQNSDILRKD
jgi:hypothetical protein